MGVMINIVETLATGMQARIRIVGDFASEPIPRLYKYDHKLICILRTKHRSTKRPCIDPIGAKKLVRSSLPTNSQIAQAE